MSRIGESVDALTVATVLAALAGGATSATVEGIAVQVAAAIGAALFTRRAGVVTRAAALTVDTLQVGAGVAAGAAVLGVGLEVFASVGAASEPLATGVGGIAAATATPVLAVVGATGGTDLTTTSAVEEVVVLVDTSLDVGTAGLGVVTLDRVVGVTATGAEAVHANPAITTGRRTVGVTADAVHTGLVGAALGLTGS
jgi:hypothetical protein